MKWNTKTVERYGLISLSILTLFALLAYTFVHTGGLLSKYVQPPEIGYVAAFGVEAAIITMSIRIGKLLRRLAQSRYKGAEGWLSLFWQGSTLLFVLAVSAAANVVEGYKVRYGLELTIDNIKDLDGLQIAIGLLATGLIPVVILSMTEIVSGEIKVALEVDLQTLDPVTATPAIELPKAEPVALPSPTPAQQAHSTLLEALKADSKPPLVDTPKKPKRAASKPTVRPGGITKRSRVRSALDEHGNLKDSELYELLPDISQSSIRVHASEWRKEYLAATNGQH